MVCGGRGNRQPVCPYPYLVLFVAGYEGDILTFEQAPDGPMCSNPGSGVGRRLNSKNIRVFQVAS